MKLLLFVLFVVVLTVALSSTFSQATTTNFILPEYSKVYNDERDPFKDAVAAIQLAKKTQRNVIIEIGGNWCTWCHRMDNFLEKHPEVYQALHNNFVVLKVNVSNSNDNETFMKSLPPVLGYPHMYVSSYTGKMLLSKDTAELQENGDYSVNSWTEFLNKWQVKPENKTNGISNVSE